MCTVKTTKKPNLEDKKCTDFQCYCSLRYGEFRTLFFEGSGGGESWLWWQGGDDITPILSPAPHFTTTISSAANGYQHNQQ